MSNDSNGRIMVRCACGAKLAFSPAAAGRKAKCPKCGQVVHIPSGEPLEGPSGVQADDDMLESLATVEKSAAAEPTCPNCRGIVLAGAVLCVGCGCDLATGKVQRTQHGTSDDRPAGPQRWRAGLGGIAGEVAIFAMGIGVLLVIIGLGLTAAHNPKAPPMLGLPRTAALVLTVLSLGVLNLASGVGLLFVRHIGLVQACMLSAMLIPIGWFGFKIAAGVNVGLDCVSVMTIVIAVLVNMRGAMGVLEIRQERGEQR